MDSSQIPLRSLVLKGRFKLLSSSGLSDVSPLFTNEDQGGKLTGPWCKIKQKQKQQKTKTTPPHPHTHLNPRFVLLFLAHQENPTRILFSPISEPGTRQASIPVRAKTNGRDITPLMFLKESRKQQRRERRLMTWYTQSLAFSMQTDKQDRVLLIP